MDTPRQLCQKLNELMPTVFGMSDDEFYALGEEGNLDAQNIFLFKFNAEGEITKASMDGWMFLFERLGVEVEVCRSTPIPVVPEDAIVWVRRIDPWRIRMWVPQGFKDSYPIAMEIAGGNSPMECLNENGWRVVEWYINIQEKP